MKSKTFAKKKKYARNIRSKHSKQYFFFSLDKGPEKWNIDSNARSAGENEGGLGRGISLDATICH